MQVTDGAVVGQLVSGALRKSYDAQEEAGSTRGVLTWGPGPTGVRSLVRFNDA